MPNSQIRADHDQLAQIAQRWTIQADAVQNSTQNVRQRLEKLKGGDWYGDSASRFYGEMDSAIMPALLRLIHALRQAAELTRRISDEMKRAEEEASQTLNGSDLANTPADSPSPFDAGSLNDVMRGGGGGGGNQGFGANASGENLGGLRSASDGGQGGSGGLTGGSAGLGGTTSDTGGGLGSGAGATGNPLGAMAGMAGLAGMAGMAGMGSTGGSGGASSPSAVAPTGEFGSGTGDSGEGSGAGGSASGGSSGGMDSSAESAGGAADNNPFSTAANQAFSPASLSNLAGANLRGAGSAAIANAMQTLLGNPTPEQEEAALKAIAEARGRALEEIRAEYEKFKQLRDVIRQTTGLTQTPVLPDNWMGSVDQLRSGYLIGQVFGIDPVFGAMLYPSGGIPGDTGGLFDASEPAARFHWSTQSAASFLKSRFDIGPGPNYMRGSVLDAIRFWRNQVSNIF
jgi:WXG100 family type VII secretion target